MPNPNLIPNPVPSTPTSTPDRDGWLPPLPVELADGTRLWLYKETQALHAAYEAIASARNRVALEAYIFHSDDTGYAFAKLLADKARAGLSVSVIYDAFGSIDTEPELFHIMHSGGVRLANFHPLDPWNCRFAWRPLNRDHRKLLLIDEHIAGVGGLNVGMEYAGSWVVPTPSKKALNDRWRDNAVAIVGPSARLFNAAFGGMWHYCTHGGPFHRVQRIANLFPAENEMGVLASAPTVDSPLKGFLCRVLRTARETIDMTMAYFAPDDPLIEELVRAARRGVHVRLMLPGKSDVRLLQIAASSFYEMLMDEGVEIYERQSVMLHAKTLVADSRFTMIGSTNLDYRSIEYNCEISAIIHSKAFGAQVRELFDNDVKHAQRIDPAVWRHRPMRDRMGQWAVSRARYLL